MMRTAAVQTPWEHMYVIQQLDPDTPIREVYITARPPDETAAAFREVRLRLEQMAEVVGIDGEEWSNGASALDPGVLHMRVRVAVAEASQALGLVAGCVARLGMSFYERFVVTEKPLDRKPGPMTGYW
jgi:hypothetical protein